MAVVCQSAFGGGKNEKENEATGSDKIIVMFGSNAQLHSEKGALFNGMIYANAEKTQVLKEYSLDLSSSSGRNSTLRSGLYNAGWFGKMYDGTPSQTKNYNGFTIGALAGAKRSMNEVLAHTFTIQDEVGNTLVSMKAGERSTLPTLSMDGYIFKGYTKVSGGGTYKNDTLNWYYVGGTTIYTVKFTAIFEKIPPYIYDIDGEIAWEYPSDSWAGELPELSRTGRIFLGYLIDGELYKAGTYFDNTKGQEIKAVFAKFGTLNGASLRLDEPTGLRYQTYLNASVYTALEGKLSFGTLIGRASDITVDGVMDYNLLTVGASYTHLDIVSNNQHEIGDYYYFKGAIVNIRESNYDLSLVGRGYMTVTYADGSTELYYAGVTDNARTVAYVAEKATEDISLVANKWYQYKVDGGYSAYDENDITLLGKWLA